MKLSKPIIWHLLKIVFAVFMMFAGAQHFYNAHFYIPVVPSFLPFKLYIVYLSGIAEVGLGLLLFFKKYTGIAAYGLFLMMLLIFRMCFRIVQPLGRTKQPLSDYPFSWCLLRLRGN